jgi:hypothetical protein|tara:strand:+ start:915 stop:1631 length:717 start_codon:yes stop_codon:yes gene_type:complete
MNSLFAILFAASVSTVEIPKEKIQPTITTIQPVVNASPQKDPKATSILKEVSAKTKSRKTISLDFTFDIKNGEVSDSQKGSLKIKDNKYTYSIFGVTKISDGIKIASVLKEDQEVTIGKIDFNDPDEFSPQEMFTIYETGYKYRFMANKVIDGESLQLIDLYPEAGNKQPYRRVTLYINDVNKEIKKIELFHKTSGKVFTVTVTKSTYDLELKDTEFICDCSRWPSPEWDCDDTSKSK